MLGTTYPLPTVGKGTHGHLLELPLCILGNQVKDTASNLVVA
jgi:hypothetical protein